MTILTLAAAGLAALALSTTPAPGEALPEFDFADCPAIPAAADPGQWRCEVLVSESTLSFGNVRDLKLGTMRLTFAEGKLDGQYAQVFGALESEPARLPGLPGTSLSLRYAGYSDFQSNDQRKGEIDLAATLDGPFLPDGCTIGDERTPIHSVLQDDGPTEVVSTDPLTLKFSASDHQLALPAATGCGIWDRVLNRRLGLPSPSGANSYEQTTYVRLRSY